MPIIKFDVDTADFGKVYEGDTVRYDFWFTNVGNKDLIIHQAWPACGCTHPAYTKEAVKPGGRSKIHVEFLSAGWGGKEVVKEVIIISNAPENYARFKAIIITITPEELKMVKLEAEKRKKEEEKKKKKKKAKTVEE